MKMNWIVRNKIANHLGNFFKDDLKIEKSKIGCLKRLIKKELKNIKDYPSSGFDGIFYIEGNEDKFFKPIFEKLGIEKCKWFFANQNIPYKFRTFSIEPPFLYSAS